MTGLSLCDSRLVEPRLPAGAEAVKRAQRALYEAGEYHALSATLAPAADALVGAAGIDGDAVVLDVAAGDGNVALAAAARGASVVACDLSPLQVERGRQRSGAAGASVSWVVADAEALPFDEGAFTHVLSAFGAVFAPRPDVVTAELFRVARRGGVVGLTAWPADSLVGESTQAAREATADGESFPDLDLGWGEPDVARERLERFGDQIAIERLELPWDPARRGSSGSADCAVSYLQARLAPDDLERLTEARAAAVARHTDASGRVCADYVLALATKR